MAVSAGCRAVSDWRSSLTRNGTLLTASENENRDLFWALRGGGGGAGLIVTRFRLRTFAVPCAVVGFLIWSDAAQFERVLSAYERFCLHGDTPDDISAYAFVEKNRLLLMCVHPSDSIDVALERFELLVAPLRALDADIVSVDIKPLCELNSQFDEGNPAGRSYHWHSNVVDRLPVAQIVQHIAQSPPGACSIEVMHWGGAIRRGADSSFPHRNAAFEAHSLVWWKPTEDGLALKSWARRFNVSDRSFVNISGDTSDTPLSHNAARVAQIYENYAKQ